MHGLPSIHVVLMMLKHVSCASISYLLNEPEELIIVDHLIKSSSEQVHQIKNLAWLNLATAHSYRVEDHIHEISLLDHPCALGVKMSEFALQVQFLPRCLQIG